MMLRFPKALVLGLTLMLAGSPAMAQQGQPASVLPNKPAAEHKPGELGDLFQSKAAGIALRPPAGSREIRKAGVPDLIVEFVDEEQAWLLRVGTLELREPRKLADWKDESGKKQRGILSETNDAFKSQNPTAEELRNEVEETDIGKIGHLAYRFSQGKSRRLMQQAFFPLTEKYYYILTFTSPGAKPGSEEADAAERLAAETFKGVLASVRLIDRGEILREQEARLKDTRQLLLTFREPKVMNKALVPEQWWRLTRDGQDMGYSYVTEERAKEDGREGVLVSVRSRTMPAPGQQVDVSSRMFISDQWQHESWSHVVSTTMDGKTEESAELGLGDLKLSYKVDAPKDLLSQPSTAKKDPDIQEIQKYKIEVRTKLGQTIAPTLERELPQEYLPQAIRHLLPRLLPLDKPGKYIFVTYVSDNRQAMLVYADVLPLREVTIDSQIHQAIPVQYRVGLEGVPTSYFVSKDGKYLGSETIYKVDGKESAIRVYPSDEAALLKLWKNAQLNKPQQSEVPTLPGKRK